MAETLQKVKFQWAKHARQNLVSQYQTKLLALCSLTWSHHKHLSIPGMEHQHTTQLRLSCSPSHAIQLFKACKSADIHYQICKIASCEWCRVAIQHHLSTKKKLLFQDLKKLFDKPDMGDVEGTFEQWKTSWIEKTWVVRNYLKDANLLGPSTCSYGKWGTVTLFHCELCCCSSCQPAWQWVSELVSEAILLYSSIANCKV